MKGFYVFVKNELLEPKHVVAMDAAVWLYLWFLDKMTSVSEEGIGKILGGKPIKWDEDVRPELGISERSYRRWVNRLRKHGYINTLRAPRGLIITVNKACKVFGQQSMKKKQSILPAAFDRFWVGYEKVTGKKPDMKDGWQFAVRMRALHKMYEGRDEAFLETIDEYFRSAVGKKFNYEWKPFTSKAVFLELFDAVQERWKRSRKWEGKASGFGNIKADDPAKRTKDQELNAMMERIQKQAPGIGYDACRSMAVRRLEERAKV